MLSTNAFWMKTISRVMSVRRFRREIATLRDLIPERSNLFQGSLKIESRVKAKIKENLNPSKSQKRRIEATIIKISRNPHWKHYQILKVSIETRKRILLLLTMLIVKAKNLFTRVVRISRSGLSIQTLADRNRSPKWYLPKTKSKA